MLHSFFHKYEYVLCFQICAFEARYSIKVFHIRVKAFKILLSSAICRALKVKHKFLQCGVHILQSGSTQLHIFIVQSLELQSFLIQKYNVLKCASSNPLNIKCKDQNKRFICKSTMFELCQYKGPICTEFGDQKAVNVESCQCNSIFCYFFKVVDA